MAAKPTLLRELNNLPEEALKEVASFISHLKKCRDRKQSPKHNGNVGDDSHEEVNLQAGKRQRCRQPDDQLIATAT